MTAGVHYMPYADTIEDLVSVVDSLLKDPVKRQEICTAAKQHVLSKHTYAHRALSILDLFNLNLYNIL